MDSNEVRDLMDQIGANYPRWVRDSFGPTLSEINANIAKLAHTTVKNNDSVAKGADREAKARERNANAIDDETKKKKKDSDAWRRTSEQSNRVLQSSIREITIFARSLSSGSIQGAVDNLSNSMASFAGMSGRLALAGGVISAVIIAAGQSFNVLTQSMSETREVFSALSEAGVSVSEGFLGIRKAAHAGNLSLEQMARAVGKNAGVFAAMGPQGAAVFASLSKALNNPETVAAKLGMRIEDVNDFLVDYLDIQKRYGNFEKLRNMNVSAASNKYLKEITLFSSAMGKSRKEILESIKRMFDNPESQATLQQIAVRTGQSFEDIAAKATVVTQVFSSMTTNTETQKRLTDLQMSIVKQQEQMYLTPDEMQKLAFARQQMPELVATMEKNASLVARQQSISLDDTKKMMMNFYNVSKDTVEKLSDAQLSQLRIAMDIGGEYGEAAKMLFDINKDVRNIDIGQNLSDLSKKLEDPTDDLLRALKQYENLFAEIRTSFTRSITEILDNPNFKNSLAKFQEWLIGFSNNVIPHIVAGFKTFVESIPTMTSAIGDAVGYIAKNIDVEQIKSRINLFVTVIQEASEIIRNIFSGDFWNQQLFGKKKDQSWGEWFIGDWGKPKETPKIEQPKRLPGTFPMQDDPGAGITVEKFADGGVVTGRTIAEIAEAGTPEMVLPLDPSLHNLAKYVASKMVEIYGSFARVQQTILISDIFRDNRKVLDEILTKALDKFMFSKENIEGIQNKIQSGDVMSETEVKQMKGMNSQGIQTGTPGNTQIAPNDNTQIFSQETLDKSKNVPIGPQSQANVKPQETQFNGETKASYEQGANKNDLMTGVYSAFRKAGFEHDAAKALSAEVGRENDFRKDLLFGSHVDPHNGAVNAGMFSWQGDRGTKFMKHMNDKGLVKDGRIVQTQEALDAQAEFVRKEMENGNKKYRDTLDTLNDPDSSYQKKAHDLGMNYIRWRYDDPRYASHHARRDRYHDQIGKLTDNKQTEVTAAKPAVPETMGPYMRANMTNPALFDQGKPSPHGEGWVMPASGRVTSPYNLQRLHPITGKIEPHPAVDIAPPTPGQRDQGVFAANEGIVQKISNHGKAGNMVEIKHKNGYTTQYLHLANTGMKEGDEVKGGQQIGVMGNTGRGTGVHLDFRVKDAKGKLIKPEEIFPELATKYEHSKKMVNAGEAAPNINGKPQTDINSKTPFITNSESNFSSTPILPTDFQKIQEQLNPSPFLTSARVSTIDKLWGFNNTAKVVDEKQSPIEFSKIEPEKQKEEIKVEDKNEEQMVKPEDEGNNLLRNLGRKLDTIDKSLKTSSGVW